MDHLHAALRDIEARLAEVPACARGPAPPWLVESMNELLDCEVFAANRPAMDGDGVWRLGEVASTKPAVLAAYDAAMSRTKRAFHYDPLRPVGGQRNVVLTLKEVHKHPPDQTCVVEDVMPEVGLGGFDQLRALICEGPVLLAWIGGFRPKPFTRRERRLFTALVPMLSRALAFHRRLADAGLGAAEVSIVLEAIAAPAFIVRRSGVVDYANAAGRLLLECGPINARQHIRDAIARPHAASFVGRMESPGRSERFLVILRDEEAVLHARLGEMARRWSATPRESEVLRLIVGGDANKEIATKLGCHEGSVERHVTSLLRKAKCDSRSRLVARFWTQC